MLIFVFKNWSIIIIVTLILTSTNLILNVIYVLWFICGEIYEILFRLFGEQKPQLYIEEFKRQWNSDWLSLCTVGPKLVYLRVLHSFHGNTVIAGVQAILISRQKARLSFHFSTQKVWRTNLYQKNLKNRLKNNPSL